MLGKFYNFHLIQFIDDKILYVCKKELYNSENQKCLWTNEKYYGARQTEESYSKEELFVTGEKCKYHIISIIKTPNFYFGHIWIG